MKGEGERQGGKEGGREERGREGGKEGGEGGKEGRREGGRGGRGEGGNEGGEGRRIVDDLNRCFYVDTHTYHTNIQRLNCYIWKQILNTVQQIKPDAKPWNY